MDVSAGGAVAGRAAHRHGGAGEPDPAAEDVVFETDSPLVCTAATLVAAWASDTETDTAADRSAVATGTATGADDVPFGLFGDPGMPLTPHELYVACDPLFDLAALFETEHLPRERRMLLVIGHGNDAAGIVIDGLPRRMVFLPESQIVPPALAAAAATAVLATYTQGPDAWFEFDYAQLLEQLVS